MNRLDAEAEAAEAQPRALCEDCGRRIIVLDDGCFRAHRDGRGHVCSNSGGWAPYWDGAEEAALEAVRSQAMLRMFATPAHAAAYGFREAREFYVGERERNRHGQ